VDPSAAMGTFLNIWRTSWAGLSRAQLAIAINKGLPKRRHISGWTIRRWEEGQPPSNTQELKALCDVMEQRALSWEERAQFQELVLAACGARQFPELFAQEGLAHRPDVDEIAELECRKLAAGRWGDSKAVHLVVVIHDVEACLFGPEASRIHPRQRRKQQVALSLLRGALCYRKSDGRKSPRAYIAQTYSTNADFIEEHFGEGGLNYGLRPLMLRVWQAWTMAHKVRDPSGRSARRLFDLAEAAEARGRPAEAAQAFLGGLHLVGESQVDGAYEALAKTAERHVRGYVPDDLIGRCGGLAHELLMDMAWAALASGFSEEARRWLDLYQALSELHSLEQAFWYIEAREWLSLEEGAATSELSSKSLREALEEGVSSYAEHLRHRPSKARAHP
jgi:hypothetical protein